MAKQDIRMTPEEVGAFLATRTTAAIVAGAEGQAPHGALARLAYDEGRVIFRIDAGSRAAKALAADGRACCIVDQRAFEGGEADYFNTKAAMLHGRAERLDDAAPGEASYAFVVEKVVSFDFAKLAGS